jgi:hypothetical protein
MITKQQLENAARAIGLEGEWSDTFPNPPKGEPMFIPLGGRGMWQPHLPITQGKADLMDLMLDLDMDVIWHKHKETVVVTNGYILNGYLDNEIKIINGDKHAALAEAVVSVASQIWESKNG